MHLRIHARAARVIALAVIASAPVAVAAEASETSRTNGFRKALTVEGVRAHQAAFQTHSDLNGGSRTGGSPGYQASAAYVADKARAAGLEVSTHSFEFLYNADRTPPTLRRESPGQRTYVDGVDFSSMTFSESVPTTTAGVWAVDLNIPATEGAPDNSNTSGCEAADFAGMPAGSIALIMRGSCPFATKSQNAEAAGAIAAIVMNEGNTAGRSGVVNGTLSGANRGAAVGASYEAGLDLANAVSNGDTGTVATIKIDRVEEMRTTENVIAETPGGNDDEVVVVGAHLDSVPRGAGINDNGSGSAGILEIAETMGSRDEWPRNTVRFMWFSAEEFGLLGSEAYVDDLSQAERDRITAMLNFDMIGSPNFVRFVYDGDNSAYPVGPGAAAGPEGSGEIERIFHDYFTSQNLASDETPFSGRSDYGPFIADGVGIPAGGLFTGAEGTKTEAQAAIYGGVAGQPYDPCYHLACDTFDNVDVQGLHQMADAAGHATLTLAQRKFAKHPLVNPAGEVSGSGGTTDGGGGLHADHDHEVESR